MGIKEIELDLEWCWIGVRTGIVPIGSEPIILSNVIIIILSPTFWQFMATRAIILCEAQPWSEAQYKGI